MNVGFFNRVNNSVNKESSWTMYSEWTSLQSVIQEEETSVSVLNKFPESAGKDVANSVVKHLAQNLGINNIHCEKSSLETDRDVQWCMEVICYGLSLPLSEHDTIKDCVNIYCEWLGALRTPKTCVPKPVCLDPNMYARKMIQHLYNLFKPRSESSSDIISKQAVLCHRVLRILQQIAQESTIIARETWEALLLFLLVINDMILSPPAVKDDIGDHMCERVISVLFEVWLLACARCFPSPPLWKTFRDMCQYWRHRPALIEQWNRINFALTSHLLKIMYGPGFPELKISEDDFHLVPYDMNDNCIAQSWYRFLHTLHNPVDLCQPTVISQTPKFLHYAISCESVMEPYEHSCLASLPHVFLKAMKGIATLVDAFLGISQSTITADETKNETSFVKFSHMQSSVTPPQQRRIAKSFSVSTSSNVSKSHQKNALINIGSSKGLSHSQHSSQSFNSTTSYSLPTVTIMETRIPLAPNRPKCNSILHLFGSWLFEALLIGMDRQPISRRQQFAEKMSNRSNPKLSMNSRRGSSQLSSESLDSQTNDSLSENYEAGRAEAIGALCRIFCAKKTGEEILPVYLARFYLAMQQGLTVNEKTTGQVLASILFNSYDLLRVDLDGIQVLVPYMLSALEMVLPDKEIKFNLSQTIPPVDLRRASINLLLSMLPLPLHFRHLPIKDLCSNPYEKSQVTFQSLRTRLVNLLFNALQCEVDSTNTQMLLGGLLLCVNDAAAFEEVEQFTVQQDSLAETSPNFLCSANISDSLSSHSMSDFSAVGSEEPASMDSESYASIDSAHALFVRATYLVCHRLISSWKTDLNISLAALELLAGFAKIKIQEQEAMECKRAVKWICDYIVNQCSRPPPAHSKDLHSTIVAAFHCVTVWLVEHPYLLQDKECLSTVLEVVELGISGSKSQAKHTDTPCMKGDKECKPASMRVRDAAEAALGCIMEQVGAFPSPCGPESVSSLLNEEILLQYCNSWNGQSVSKEEAIAHFRYFVLENAHILALLEQPLGNDQDPQPTVTVLIRSPCGRNAWTVQHRHLPRHKSGAKCYTLNPGRPLPMNDLGIMHDVKQRCFPESVERIPQCRAEKSIPSLDSLMSDPQIAQDYEKLSKLLDVETAYEKKIQAKMESETSEYPNPETECRIPSLCQEFQTSRLFLSQFGFLSLEALKDSLTYPVPPLVALNTSVSNFSIDLEALDNISSRTYDTVYIFYVKSFQKTAHEILNNVTSRQNVHPFFLEFLLSLGWPVDVGNHPGWTGQISTSWKVNKENNPDTKDPNSVDHGGSLYNGQKKVLYWADFSSEIAFVVPSPKPPSGSKENEEDSCENKTSAKTMTNFDRNASERQSMPMQMASSHDDITKPRTLSLDLDKMAPKDQESPSDTRAKKFGRQFSTAAGCDTKVIIVWLESFEDHFNFLLSDVLQETILVGDSNRVNEKDLFVIYIHALQSGLFRIHMQGQSSRSSLAIPLVDGMVVSRRVLGVLIRQTALNICRRRRLENDGYHPPHVRRKLKIQEIINKYHKKMTEPEFYTGLFSTPPEE